MVTENANGSVALRENEIISW